jgi:Bacterial protein of unknown function (DUF853)
MKHMHKRDIPALGIHDHLASICIPLMIGIALGIGTLLALRVARLRWTWALLGMPLAYLAWPLNWQVGLTAAIVSTTAAGGGLYWHLQDIGRGGEEARAVRNAMGPLHVMRSWVARRRASEGRMRLGGRDALGRTQEDRLALGQTRKGGVRHVPLGLSRGVHSFVIGATGAGKTVTQAAIAQAHILAGLPVIVIDPKGDRYMCHVLQEAAEQTGARFRAWSPAG